MRSDKRATNKASHCSWAGPINMSSDEGRQVTAPPTHAKIGAVSRE